MQRGGRGGCRQKCVVQVQTEGRQDPSQSVPREHGLPTGPGHPRCLLGQPQQMSQPASRFSVPTPLWKRQARQRGLDLGGEPANPGSWSDRPSQPWGEAGGALSQPRALWLARRETRGFQLSAAPGLSLGMAGADEGGEVGCCVLSGVHPASKDNR